MWIFAWPQRELWLSSLSFYSCSFGILQISLQGDHVAISKAGLACLSPYSGLLPRPGLDSQPVADARQQMLPGKRYFCDQQRQFPVPSRALHSLILFSETLPFAGLSYLSTKRQWEISLCFSEKSEFLLSSENDTFPFSYERTNFSFAIATGYYRNQWKTHSNLSITGFLLFCHLPVHTLLKCSQSTMEGQAPATTTV